MSDTIRPLPWLVLVLASVGLLIASWNVFPTNDEGGMWATNLIGVLATIGLFCAAWLNSSLPKAAGIGFAVLAGIAAILIGALANADSTLITVFCCGCGALIAAGAAASAA
jgi:hypothetical protein